MDCIQNPWQRPLLAQPGPRRLAIHWACRSSLNSRSSRPATSLLWAATLACGEITPILENRDLLNFLYRYGIFWMPPGESSHPGGSEYVWQRGVEGVLG